MNPSPFDDPPYGDPYGTDGEPAVPEADDGPQLLEPALAVCWRCGKESDSTAERCPYCFAHRERAEPLRREVRRRLAGGEIAAHSAPMKALLWHFVAFLGTSVVFGWIIQFGVRVNGPNAFDEKTIWKLIFGVEMIDAMLTGMGLYLIARPPRLPAISVERRLLAWILGPLILAAMLGVNLAYHWLITRVAPQQEVELMPTEWWIAIPLICLQPAVVEEVFFRYLALGTLRRHLSDHGAVLVSSVMFGMAHIFVPVSIPILIVVGVFLGYARLWSGGLLLPMALHFAHNFVVWLLTIHQLI